MVLDKLSVPGRKRGKKKSEIGQTRKKKKYAKNQVRHTAPTASIAKPCLDWLSLVLLFSKQRIHSPINVKYRGNINYYLTWFCVKKLAEKKEQYF